MEYYKSEDDVQIKKSVNPTEVTWKKDKVP